MFVVSELKMWKFVNKGLNFRHEVISSQLFLSGGPYPQGGHHSISAQIITLFYVKLSFFSKFLLCFARIIILLLVWFSHKSEFKDGTLIF